MPLSMYEASVPVFCRGLRNLSAILDRAERQAAERRIERLCSSTRGSRPTCTH